MKRAMAVAAVAAVAFLVAARAPAGDASADDLKKLQGTWKVVDVESTKKNVGFADRCR